MEKLPVLVEFYGDGHDELHGGFNFVFINAPLEAAALRAVVEETEALLPEGAWPIWTASNHDVSRLATRWAAGEPAKVKLALLLLLTLRGTPFLYQGDEIGLVDGPVQREDVLDAVGVALLARLQGPRRRAHTDAVERRAGRRVHAGRRPPVAAHGRPGAVQRGRPGGRPRLATRAVPPHHRGAARPARTWPSARTGRCHPPTAPGPTPAATAPPCCSTCRARRCRSAAWPGR